MSKLKIDNDLLAEEFFESAMLIGIVAPVKSYTFCWHLNQVTGFDFRLSNDLEIHLNKKGRQYYFGVYEYNVPGTQTTHYIYNNQFDGEYLLPEFKHLDFLWLVKGDVFTNEDLEELQKQLREVNGVQLVSALNLSLLKNKAHLIF